MKLNRSVCITVCLTVTLAVCSSFREPKEEEDPKENPGFFPILHQNKPRIFGVFSKPPEPDAHQQTGPGLMGHIGNVLQGGSIGIELSARPLGTLLGHAKKLIPGGHGTVGQPQFEKPHEPPQTEWEMKKPEKKPMKEPMKEPEPEGYNWDDIGEHQLEPSTELPIEDLINPRVRPKRFIESKIYHVPLTFRSNGKPFKVVEKTPNSVDTKALTSAQKE